MSWTDTHRRWRAMREIEELLAAEPDRELPWREEYAELFGDRAGLLAALRYRWNLAQSTQLDPDLPDEVREEQQRRLVRRSRGVLRVLGVLGGPDVPDLPDVPDGRGAGGAGRRTAV